MCTDTTSEVGRASGLGRVTPRSGGEYDFGMSLREDVLRTKRNEVLRLVRAHRGRRAFLFGSVARGEEGPASDVDLLVDFEEGSSLFDLMHLEDELRVLLGVSVDVVSVGGLRPRDERIRREAVPI